MNFGNLAAAVAGTTTAEQDITNLYDAADLRVSQAETNQNSLSLKPLGYYTTRRL